jgi:pyridoxal phosphate enzyme (YggS family)
MKERGDAIAERLGEVRQRIAAAAARSGRPASAVRLVAVTKYVGPEDIARLVAEECFDLGESRPQQLWDRAAALPDPRIHWHLIGHLQRNKVRRTLPLIHWLHSGDSWRLLQAVDETACELGRIIPTLLEVNISGEASKHGFAPAEIAPLLPEIAKLQGIQVHGLMTIASLAGDLQDARREFAALRTLRDQLRSHCPETIQLNELSMGMSRDFEQAIEEGATMVRVGSCLFPES